MKTECPKRIMYKYAQFTISTGQVKIHIKGTDYILKGTEALFWCFIDGTRDLEMISKELSVSTETAIITWKKLLQKKLVRA